MRVLLVRGEATGGIAAHVQDIAEILTAQGEHVMVASPSETGAGYVPIAAQAHPKNDANTVAKLRKLMRGADVVHAHGYRAGALCAAGLTFMGKAAPRLIVTWHNALPSGGKARTLAKSLARIQAKRSDVILGVSQDLVDQAKAYGAAETALAHVPVPAHLLQPLPRKARHGAGGSVGIPFLLSVGRLTEQKGFDVLLAAAEKSVALRERSVQLYIVGDGPLREELQATAESIRGVRLLGQRRDVPDLLAQSRAVVMSSRWEGQSVFLQQAIHAGKAIITTTAGGNPAVAGQGAYFVDAGDVDSLAAAIDAVATNQDLVHTLESASRQQAHQLSTKEDLSRQVLNVYRPGLR